MSNVTEEAKTTERARSTAARAQRSIEDAQEATSVVLRDIVAAWADAIRLFIPPAALLPEAAVGIVATAIQQAFELQPRFLEEMLQVSRDAVVNTDLERFSVRAFTNGRAA